MGVRRVAESETQMMRRLNRALAVDTELDGNDLRLFLYVTSILNFETFTVVPQIELATILGRRKEHISRSMRNLEARGIILPGPKVGRSQEWRLNPDHW